jgi:wyosine [tRNA(Phe)-imidazoG37] synthetase (radical SAM superfamily)
MKYIYGPVPSRRLGASLGIDLVPSKTCSYDCIYCQCGHTTNKTLQRKEYVPITEVIKEIKEFLSSYKGKLDYLTLSGAGEPTLNSGLGEVIQYLKKLTNIPVAVLTNSSLLWRPDVREELMNADLVLPSLDAATPRAFLAVNHPKYIKIQTIINGLVEFRNCFKGKIWLEIFLVQVYNDEIGNLKALKKAIKQIRPDKIQLNTVTRPPSEDFACPIDANRMRRLVSFFGPKSEIIADRKIVISPESDEKNIQDRIIALLARRPCLMSEITGSLGMNESIVVKYISDLEDRRKIKYTTANNRIYYHLRKNKVSMVT